LHRGSSKGCLWEPVSLGLQQALDRKEQLERECL
jgi:hypothetical protein